MCVSNGAPSEVTKCVIGTNPAATEQTDKIINGNFIEADPSAWPAKWIDRNIVDGFMNGLGHVTATTSNLIKGVQSGKVQNYALYFFGGVAGLAVLFVYLWK